VETTGKEVSASRIRAAVRSYGLQKQLAAEIGTSDANLSKFLDGQLPVFLRLLDLLDLEVVDRGEVDDLRRVLKRCL
jgi:hypothetical protein